MSYRWRLARNLLIACAALGAAALAVMRWGWFDDKLPAARFLDRNTTAPAGTKYATFFSPTINGQASYLIWLPPGYDASAETRYPVVYYLHGLHQSARHGEPFVRQLDAAIASGHAPPMIAVLVNGLPYSRYYDSKDGTMPVATVIIRDLIPHIDATYRTLGTRDGRAIEGFSMGGFGAVRLGFKHPELFSGVTSLAGAIRDHNSIRGHPGGGWTPTHFRKVFDGDTEYYRVTSPQVLAEQNAEMLRTQVKIRLISGDEDRQQRQSERFSTLLETLNIPHQEITLPDVGHNEHKLYDRLGAVHFEFYRELFGKNH